MKHLLVIRNSSMGDVALTVPAVKAALDTYPALKVTFVSNQRFAPFFEGIERLHFFATDFKSAHKGLKGIFKLAFELRKLGPFDAVLDLHSVIRSWMIAASFSATGIPVFRIDKGREGKRALTRQHHKLLKPLRPAHERYAAVFGRAGFHISLGSGPWLKAIDFPASFFLDKLLLPKKGFWLGIAPFTQHTGKMWPVIKSEQLIRELTEAGHVVFLFGGGREEIDCLDLIASKYQRVFSLAGKLSLNSELAVMQQMDVMVTMDSSNLHMASLVGVPVISIWGSTHSYGGFGPLGSNKDLKVEVDPSALTCRPCSIFGNKPCFRGDYACLNWIEVKEVRKKISKVLEKIPHD